MKISDQKLGVFFAPLDLVRGYTDKGIYKSVLDDTEKKRYSRYRFDKDKHLFLVSRAMTRFVLSKYLSCAPQDVKFQQDDFGKPYVVTGSQCRQIEFNVSHTDGCAMCVVGVNRRVGVDVEMVLNHFEVMTIAKNFFALQEVAVLSRLKQSERLSRFYECWTLKEAFLKALGQGLTIPLDNFFFNLEAGKPITVRKSRDANSLVTCWAFSSFYLSSGHRGALCVEKNGQGLEVLKPHAYLVRPLDSIIPAPIKFSSVIGSR